MKKILRCTYTHFNILQDFCKNAVSFTKTDKCPQIAMFLLIFAD